MPELPVVVDLPAFTLSAMVTVAPEMTVALMLSVTVPLNENVVGVGVGDGAVEVLLPPPHAEMETPRTRVARTRFIGHLASESSGMDERG